MFLLLCVINEFIDCGIGSRIDRSFRTAYYSCYVFVACLFSVREKTTFCYLSTVFRSGFFGFHDIFRKVCLWWNLSLTSNDALCFLLLSYFMSIADSWPVVTHNRSSAYIINSKHNQPQYSKLRHWIEFKWISKCFNRKQKKQSIGKQWFIQNVCGDRLWCAPFVTIVNVQCSIDAYNREVSGIHKTDGYESIDRHFFSPARYDRRVAVTTNSCKTSFKPKFSTNFTRIKITLIYLN